MHGLCVVFFIAVYYCSRGFCRTVPQWSTGRSWVASRAGSLPSLPSCNQDRPWHRKSRDKPQQGCCESAHRKSNGYPQNAPAAGQDVSLKRSCCPAVGRGACVWEGKGFLLLLPFAERETEAREGAAVCSKVKQESEQFSHSSKCLSMYPVCPVHSQFLQHPPQTQQPTAGLAPIAVLWSPMERLPQPSGCKGWALH